MSRKSKVAAEIKLELVERYLKGEVSLKQAAALAGVDQMSFRRWLNLYEAKGATELLTSEKNRAYSKELKIAAVHSYLAGEGSLLDICKKYNIRSDSLLRKWIKLYNTHEDLKASGGGGSYMRKARKTTIEERLSIVNACLENDKNYAFTAKEYSVSYQQVRNWVLRYEEMGTAGLEDRRGYRTGTRPSRTPEEEMKDQIAQLKREKRELQMENDLLKKVKELERRDPFL